MARRDETQPAPRRVSRSGAPSPLGAIYDRYAPEQSCGRRPAALTYTKGFFDEAFSDADFELSAAGGRPRTFVAVGEVYATASPGVWRQCVAGRIEGDIWIALGIGFNRCREPAIALWKRVPNVVPVPVSRARQHERGKGRAADPKDHACARRPDVREVPRARRQCCDERSVISVGDVCLKCKLDRILRARANRDTGSVYPAVPSRNATRNGSGLLKASWGRT